MEVMQWTRYSRICRFVPFKTSITALNQLLWVVVKVFPRITVIPLCTGKTVGASGNSASNRSSFCSAIDSTTQGFEL